MELEIEGADADLTLEEAMRYVGCSRPTLWRIINDNGIETYEDPSDRRCKFVKRAALTPYRRKRPSKRGKIIHREDNGFAPS